MNKLLAKTLYGLEGVLKAELESIGAGKVIKGRRSVGFEGDREMLYRANYSLHTALSILKPLLSFNIAKARDLYSKSLEYPWENIMGVGQSFSIVPVINSSLFNHTVYPALVLKDAIADRFRKQTGRRPSVDTKDPDIVFNCHISEKHVDISLDSSVVPLFKRGYRRMRSEALLNEVLAAGIIMMTGWNMRSPLLDPMCGSGTIAIEATLLARGIPPGKFRSFFGFMNWPDYDHELYKRVCREAESKIVPLQTSISCMDNSPRSISIARSNIRAIELEGDIHTELADFLDSDSHGSTYTIIMNPPYGERLDNVNIENLYTGIGERLKHAYTGSTAWLISSNKEAIAKVGLKPSLKYTLYNGKLEVKLLKFELYSGSIKDKR
ncbi:MAG: class I SAM-dependent RNA methyltransferase [Bacteroidota bacterium]|nr:class I SAM-dependent RNA methyltransferase [Bacteroidota bacterium]